MPRRCRWPTAPVWAECHRTAPVGGVGEQGRRLGQQACAPHVVAVGVGEAASHLNGCGRRLAFIQVHVYKSSRSQVDVASPDSTDTLWRSLDSEHAALRSRTLKEYLHTICTRYASFLHPRELQCSVTAIICGNFSPHLARPRRPAGPGRGEQRRGRRCTGPVLCFNRIEAQFARPVVFRARRH